MNLVLIPGYEGKYAVCDEKYIVQLEKYGKVLPAPFFLREMHDQYGYAYVSIYRNRKNSSQRVHRLLMLTFCGPSNGLSVNHKDGDKKNNSLSNLEYVTHKDNIRHAHKMGLCTTHRGELHSGNKIPEDEIIRIKMEYSSYTMVNRKPYRGFFKDHAIRLGVSDTVIHYIAKGRNWSYLNPNGDVIR